jgi:hypothetical protein
VEDAFTPVTVTTVAPRTGAVRGADGRYHVLYELVLTNAKAATATVRGIEVLDARDPARTVARYAGAELVAQLRTLQPGPVPDATIEPNAGRLFFVALAFDSADEVPRRVVHHLDVLAADNPAATTPSPLAYPVTPFDIAAVEAPRLGPPVRGDGWVAVNGCCDSPGVHMGAVQSVNGTLVNSQRYAIDWMRLDARRRFVHGDPDRVGNYASYGADVIAVADGTVVETLDTLPDQPPGQLPDPATITLATVDGNHVVLDIGGGNFVFYAHLQSRSVVVRVGERVRRGQLLARLGNSGNTSAPHLHVHVMNGPSPIAADGIPYVYDQFRLTGQIDPAAWEAAPTIEGVWDTHPLNPPRAIRNALPLDLNVLDFPR